MQQPARDVIGRLGAAERKRSDRAEHHRHDREREHRQQQIGRPPHPLRAPRRPAGLYPARLYPARLYPARLPGAPAGRLTPRPPEPPPALNPARLNLARLNLARGRFRPPGDHAADDRAVLAVRFTDCADRHAAPATPDIAGHSDLVAEPHTNRHNRTTRPTPASPKRDCGELGAAPDP